MTSHIGIIGCSAEGAALCYRAICTGGEALFGPHGHPEVTLHTPPLADYVACLGRGDLDGVAALMLQSARVLADAGADFLICPDNTIHQALPAIRSRLPRPLLHIAEVVGDRAEQGGYRKLGLLGTRWLVDSDVYPDALAARGIGWQRPGTEDRDMIDRLIMEEMVRGVFSQRAADLHREVIARLARQGCDAVVLGCTEIPILMAEREAALPMLDSTRLLAASALEHAARDRVLPST